MSTPSLLLWKRGPLGITLTSPTTGKVGRKFSNSVWLIFLLKKAGSGQRSCQRATSLNGESLIKCFPLDPKFPSWNLTCVTTSLTKKSLEIKRDFFYVGV